MLFTLVVPQEFVHIVFINPRDPMEISPLFKVQDYVMYVLMVELVKWVFGWHVTEDVMPDLVILDPNALPVVDLRYVLKVVLDVGQLLVSECAV
jgi:hypothetical protein